jgi:lipoprotein-releasing system ATP-binding protein
MIIAENISKSYGELHVLKDVSIKIAEAEIISIIGKSGAGKTTLLHILGTLDKADSGKLLLDGKELSGLKEKELAVIRNKHIGFVFQFHHLLDEFTALENTMIPALISGTNEKIAQKQAVEILDYLGLKDRLEHKPSELSGGEQQRVAIARALINRPKVVFADEPTGNLDSQTSAEIHELILKLRKEFNQTFVIVTHNQDLARMSDKIYRMEDGMISDHSLD